MKRIFLTVSAILSVIVLGILFWGLVSGKEQPPAASGAALVSVQVPALEGDALAGETLFRENCASCHGDNAAGRDGISEHAASSCWQQTRQQNASTLAPTVASKPLATLPAR